MWWTDLLLFFFPNLCLICGKRLPCFREVLCLNCEFKMPRTRYSNRIDNPVSQSFWGRVPVEMGTSLFKFEKGSDYQTLLHELKYRGNKKAGIYLGRLLGSELLYSTYSSCDVMIPVPLHPKRLKKRGYNQSEIIASGISDVTGIPVATGVIMRSIHQKSQTSMGRYDRFENVNGNFKICPEAPDLNEKKILLVDDVLTTGSTLEACSIELLNHYRCLVFVATICCA